MNKWFFWNKEYKILILKVLNCLSLVEEPEGLAHCDKHQVLIGFLAYFLNEGLFKNCKDPKGLFRVSTEVGITSYFEVCTFV